MEISKTSWHYKVVRHFYNGCESIPSNLCSYMRWLVFGMFLIAIVSVVLTAVALFLLACSLASLAVIVKTYIYAIPWLPDIVMPFSFLRTRA